MKKQNLTDVLTTKSKNKISENENVIVQILENLSLDKLKVTDFSPIHLNEVVLSLQQQGYNEEAIEKLIQVTYERLLQKKFTPPVWLDFFYTPPAMVVLQIYELEILSQLTLTGKEDQTRDMILWGCFAGMPLDMSSGYNLPPSQKNLEELTFCLSENPDFQSDVLNTRLIDHLRGKYPSELPILKENEFREYASSILTKANIQRKVLLLSEAMDFKDTYYVPLPYVIRSRYNLITAMLFRQRYCQTPQGKAYWRHARNTPFAAHAGRILVEPHDYIYWEKSSIIQRETL